MTGESPVAELLADNDPEARRHGAQRLSELKGLEAIALLARALGDTDWRVRKEAAAVAPSVVPRQAVIEQLALALNDRDNVGLRNAAVEALVLIGSDAVPIAVEALARLDADGRKLAVEVLGGVPHLVGTQALARALSDDDVNVRAAAAEALGSASLAGAEAQRLAVTALTAALADDEPLRRLAALGSLTRLEAKLPWDVFEPLTTDPLLRRYAIATAGRTHEASAIAALARATGDPAAAIARDALVALVACLVAHLGTEELARRELLASAVAQQRIRRFASAIDDPLVRGAALAVLGLLRVRSDMPALVRGLSDDDVSEYAEMGLRWFGQDAVAPLLDEGKRSSPPLRAATLSLIPFLTERADLTTSETLREALKSDAPEVQAAALQAIAVTGNAADLEFLALHATSSDARVAATACAAITTLASRHVLEGRAMAERIRADSPLAVVGCLLRGVSAKSAGIAGDIEFLRGALDHDDVRVRRAAVDALSAIGGPLAAQVVARARADEERDVVLAAVRALGRMGQAEPLILLLEGVHDTAVVAGALRALGEASPGRAFDAAWGLLRSDDPMLAASAVETIGRRTGSRRDEGLQVALDHRDPGVVKSALVELSRHISPKILARIGQCLDSPSYEVRRFAAELLADADDAATHTLIRSRLDRETDPVVRDALTLALVAHAVKEAP